MKDKQIAMIVKESEAKQTTGWIVFFNEAEDKEKAESYGLSFSKISNIFMHLEGSVKDFFRFAQENSRYIISFSQGD